MFKQKKISCFFITFVLILFFFISFGSAQEISDNELNKITDYAMLSKAPYGAPAELTEPIGDKSRGYWHRIDRGDTNSGLDWTLFERTSKDGKIERTLSFTGTEDLRDGITDLTQTLIKPTQYKDALKVAEKILKETDKQKNIFLTVTGHSLGGGLAQYVSLSTGIQAYVFNSAPLGLEIRLTTKKQAADLADNNIKNFHFDGDFVYGTPGKQYGKQFIIKSPDKYKISQVHYMEPIISTLEKFRESSVTAYKKPNYSQQLVKVYRNSTESLVNNIKNTAEIFREISKTRRNNSDFTRYWKGQDGKSYIDSLDRAGKIAGNFNEILDIADAINKDIESSKKGKYVFIRSHTLEQLGKSGIKHLNTAIDILKNKNFIRKNSFVRISPVLSNAIDILPTSSKDIGKGKADIDSIEIYLDAANKVAWRTLGMIVSGGNASVGQTFQTFVDAAAKTGRKLTLNSFTKWHARRDGNPQRVIEDYKQLLESSVSRNVPIRKFENIYGRDAFKNLGFSKNDKKIAADIFSAHKTEMNERYGNINSFSTNTSSSDIKIMDRLADSSSRIVIYGKGEKTRDAYDSAVSRLGTNNVKWVKSYPNNYYKERIARSFGADTIQTIRRRQYSYREVNNRGNTIRTPITPNYNHSTIKDTKKYQNSIPDISSPRLETHIPRMNAPLPERRQRPDFYDRVKDPLFFQDRRGGMPLSGGGHPPYRGGGGFSSGSSGNFENIGNIGSMNRINSISSRYSPGVGGVMLKGAANLDSGSDLNAGNFSLIFENSNGEVDVHKLRMFVTALWAVYFSKEGPGISIDPIAPDIDKHLVRYIGHVVNSDLGRVMRETDYMMKKWAVGTDRADLPDFENPDDIAGRRGTIGKGSWSRFWFLPTDMKFRQAGNMLLFEDGRMTLKTEYMFTDRRGQTDPDNEAFAQYFTKNYWKIAQKYSIYDELFEYAKLVSLAKYLKEKKVPMLWFLLANRDMVITEDSPGTVNALAKKSEYFEHIEIKGGVDLAMKPSSTNYVIDNEAARALKKAYQLYGNSSSRDTSISPSRTISFETEKADYTMTASQNLTISGSAVAGETYQTDIALQKDGEPHLELVRFYDPYIENVSSFGKGWHVMTPYRVVPYGEKMIEEFGALIHDRMMIKNLLTGDKEILTFDKKRFGIAGYLPENPEKTTTIGLFLMSNASYRLADKLGSEFRFNSAGYLTGMLLTNNFHVKYKYKRKETGWKVYDNPPYKIEPAGGERTQVLNVFVPKMISLVDTSNGKKEIFSLNTDSDIIGYSPIDKIWSKYRFISIMSDGTYLLEDNVSNTIGFGGNNSLKFSKIVMESLSQGNSIVNFEYEFHNGQFRIKEAVVSKEKQSAILHSVKYKYDKSGRLSKVITPGGKEIEISYGTDRIMIARR